MKASIRYSKLSNIHTAYVTARRETGLCQDFVLIRLDQYVEKTTFGYCTSTLITARMTDNHE